MDQNYIIEVRPQDLISERTKFYEKLTENSSGSVIRKIERMQKIKVKPLLHINYLDKTHKNCSLKLPPKSINQEINTRVYQKIYGHRKSKIASRYVL